MTDRARAGGRPELSADDRLEQSLARELDAASTGQATAAQCAQLFRRDKNTVKRLLSSLTPAGHRKGFPVYWIDEAATMMVRPGYEIEDAIKRMNRADVPSGLTAEFWSGQKSRLLFELEQGDLWRTADVVSVFATTFNELRMALLLIMDRVESEISLTPRQREIIRRITEGAINAMQETLVTAFADYQPPVDNIAGADERL